MKFPHAIRAANPDFLRLRVPGILAMWTFRFGFGHTIGNINVIVVVFNHRRIVLHCISSVKRLIYRRPLSGLLTILAFLRKHKGQPINAMTIAYALEEWG